MVKDEVPEAGSEPVPRQGTHREGDILTEDRGGGRARAGRLAPASEELARGAVGPEGLELRELLSRYEEDDISLVDLWLVLVRRRFIFTAAVLASVLAGLLFAFLKTPTYTFTTMIQIGRIVELRGLGETVASETPNESLESVGTVVAKLNAAYITTILAEYVDEAGDRTAPKIEASSPDQSQLVLIKSKSPEKEAELHMNLHKKVMEPLLADHADLIANFRKSLDLRLTQETGKYESLLDQEPVLANHLKLLDDTKALLEKQIGQIQDLLSSTASGLERALSEVGDEAKALTFLVAGNEIQQSRTRLAALEERLHIGLPQQRITLGKQLADVKRHMTTQQEYISMIEMGLRSIRDTRVLVGPARSLEPVSAGRAVVLSLAAVAGLFLGILAAFFAEFLAKARAAMAEAKTPASREPAVRGG